MEDKYRYNAYGELLERSGDTENHFLYTGEYYDGVSDLYYLRARYMSTSTGTFISMDTYEGSIYDPDSLHKYLYANGNPVMYSDPSGNMATFTESAIATSVNNILTGVQTIHLNAMLSGAVNMAIKSMLGVEGMDLVNSFMEGYKVGLAISSILYLAAAISVQAFVVVNLGMAIANVAMSITFMIGAVQSGNSKAKLVGTVLLVTAVAALLGSIGITCDVYASGNRGSTNFELDFTDFDNPVINEGGTGSASNIEDKLMDVLSMKTSDALDAGSDFLGDSYTEPKPGSGRFVSADGTYVFRMGDNDILGKHGGGSHVNFEILEPNPAKPGKMQVIKDIHIFLED